MESAKIESVERVKIESVKRVKIIIMFSQDGALLSNNPSAIALHEARLLWGTAETPPPIQCLVSLGTGRYVKKDEDQNNNCTSLREKLTKVVASATDTEGSVQYVYQIVPQFLGN